MQTNDLPDSQIAYTIEDAARRATICRTGIYAAVRDGKLKARKSGRRTIILDQDLRAWLAGLPATREVV